MPQVKCDESLEGDSLSCANCRRVKVPCVWGERSSQSSQAAATAASSSSSQLPRLSRVPSQPQPRRLVCDRCRLNKYGCDLARPCGRCRERGVECTYPKYARPHPRDSVAREQATPLEGGASTWYELWLCAPWVSADTADCRRDVGKSERRRLLDLYFTSVYATMWHAYLHRGTLTHDFEHDGASELVIQSACLAACTFDTSGFRGHGAAWSKEVERELYLAQTSSPPSADLVAAALNLAFYDFAHGNSARLWITAGFAVR